MKIHMMKKIKEIKEEKDIKEYIEIGIFIEIDIMKAEVEALTKIEVVGAGVGVKAEVLTEI